MKILEHDDEQNIKAFLNSLSHDQYIKLKEFINNYQINSHSVDISVFEKILNEKTED